MGLASDPSYTSCPIEPKSSGNDRRPVTFLEDVGDSIGGSVGEETLNYRNRCDLKMCVGWKSSMSGGPQSSEDVLRWMII
jgi:hypothetical protein